MITANIDGKEVSMKKPSVVGILSGIDAAKIKNTLDVLLAVDELKKIQGFEEDCRYVQNNFQAPERTDQYFKARDRILRAVRNHGIPRRGHLDDAAKKLIEKYKNECHRLLDDASVAESFDVVLAHYGRGEYSPRYEAHLNHLNEVIIRNTRNQERYGLAKLASSKP